MSTSIREVTSAAILEEKKKLRKEFRLFDMIFYTISALVGLDTLGAFAANGGQALTWLLISAVTFLFPYGLLTAELGSTFTQEGGMYEWCKLAGGRIFASIAAMLYWISNPLWVGGTLSVTAIAAIKILWFGSSKYLFGGSVVSDAIIEMLIALVFIWATVWCAITSLRFGKWLSVIGSYVKLALLVIFAILAVVFIFSGAGKGAHIGVADFIPSNWGQILSGILPVLIFSWVGFELQNGAGEEIERPQRDVPLSLIRSGIVATVAYSLFLVFILLALPKDQLVGVSGFISAIQIVSNVLPGPVATVLGWIIAVGVVFGLASSGGTWIIGADRTYAIAALDRTAPVFLGRFSGKYGTPVAVNTMSGIVATVAMAAAISITAFASGGSLASLFSIVLGFTISTTTLSYLFIFPAFLILRYKFPNVRRPYKVPGGMVVAWIVTILPFAYAAIASYFVLIPTDGSVASTGVSRLTYELVEFGALAVIVVLTIAFYIWGQKEKKNKDVVVDVNFSEEGLTEAEVSAAD